LRIISPLVDKWDEDETRRRRAKKLLRKVEEGRWCRVDEDYAVIGATPRKTRLDQDDQDYFDKGLLLGRAGPVLTKLVLVFKG
jgi:hypothetical protein